MFKVSRWLCADLKPWNPETLEAFQVECLRFKVSCLTKPNLKP